MVVDIRRERGRGRSRGKDNEESESESEGRLGSGQEDQRLCRREMGPGILWISMHRVSEAWLSQVGTLTELLAAAVVIEAEVARA